MLKNDLIFKHFYRKEVKKKGKEGQPASFTDIFGHLLGQHLLGGQVSFARIN